MSYPIFSVAKNTLPDWVVKGHTQFQNQHAGPAEVAKDILFQFTTLGSSFNDLMEADNLFCANLTPQVIWDWTNKLSDSFLDEMEALGKDLIQVPWSVGFSIQSEAIQRDVFIDFAKRAQKRGIKVCAYLSLTNIFWKDTFEFEPFLKESVAVYSNGKPHLYGFCQARFLACVNSKSWIDYIKSKVKMALEEADVDTIYFDNLSADCACDTCRNLFRDFTERLTGKAMELPEIIQPMPIKLAPKEEVEVALAEKNQQAVYSGDVKQRAYLLKRFQAWRLAEALKDIRDFAFNIKSPLGFSANNHLEPHVNDVCNIIYSQDTKLPGFNWSNIPILRYLEADCDGWKQQITNHPLPDGHDPRLSIAEAVSFQGYAYQNNHQGYNQFYKNNPDIYQNIQSTARIAVITEYPRRLPFYLQPLGLSNLMYDIVIKNKCSNDILQKYDLIILPDLGAVSDRLVDCLEQLEDSGKTVLYLGQNRCNDGFGAPRKGVPYSEALETDARMAEETIARIKSEFFTQQIQVKADASIAANFVKKKHNDTYICHLINYDEKVVNNVKLMINISGFNVSKVSLLSPDSPGEEVTLDYSNGIVTIHKMDIYSILIIT